MPEAIDSRPKDSALPHLPQTQRSEVWDTTENDFWRANGAKRQDEYAQVSQRWHEHKQSAIAGIHSLESEARKLRETEEQLNKKLMAVHNQAALVEEIYKQEMHRLSDMEMQQNREMQELFKRDERIKPKMQNFFKHCRNNDGVQERQWALSGLIDKRLSERQRQPPRHPSLAKLDLPGQHSKTEYQIIAIIDADDKILDKLQYLGPPQRIHGSHLRARRTPADQSSQFQTLR